MQQAHCSKCDGINDRNGQRYCKACHAKYMRDNRKSWAAFTDAQKERDSARSMLHTYVKRGKVVKPDACSECGNVAKVEGHHHNYKKPLEVVWLCRPCHLSLHNSEKGI